MNPIQRLVTLVAVFLLVSGMPAGGRNAAAQAWPERPVKVFVGSAPGSAPDIVARLLAEQLATLWGKPVVIENRPGAGGNLGAQAAARAPADGHHFWFAHATPVVMNQFLFKSPGFEAERDFLPVVRIGINPMVIAVNPALPVRSLEELIAASKADRDGWSFGTSGSKNIPHLIGEALNQTAGTRLIHVPYKGSQQAAQDTIGGLVQVYIDALPPMSGLLQSGRLRALAVTAPSRVAGFEHIPTAREAGTPMVMIGWMALLSPAQTSREVVARVNRDTNSVLARPEVAARLHALGTYELGGTTRALETFIDDERRLWERVVRLAGIVRE